MVHVSSDGMVLRTRNRPQKAPAVSFAVRRHAFPLLLIYIASGGREATAARISVVIEAYTLYAFIQSGSKLGVHIYRALVYA